MRIALVVQRYGLDVMGGSELHARLLAEHLQPYMQVEVLTTCAKDMLTWQDHYPPGTQQINGITVHRFPVRQPRDVARFTQLSSKVFDRQYDGQFEGQADYFEQIEWMRRQGPDCPALLQYIRDNRSHYDLFVFMTYLYANTFIGLQLVPEKSILISTSHDEPPIYLDLFRSTFALPRGIIFNTADERDFVHQRFGNAHIPHTVLGVGIETPDIPNTAVTETDYLLYMGRVDPSKGSDKLFDYFLAYKRQTQDPVKLVLVGTPLMPIPNHPDIVALGYLPGDERFAWLQKASVYVHPSPYESLSMSTLEAWSLGVPVLVNGQAAPLKAHIQRSNGGFYFLSQDEFLAHLRRLRAESALRAEMGARGRAYVQEFYEWRKITEGHIAFFKQMYRAVAAPSH
jgi:glycosyltransferase involved in cell wall biosynthesis